MNSKGTITNDRDCFDWLRRRLVRDGGPVYRRYDRARCASCRHSPATPDLRLDTSYLYKDM